MGAGSRCKALFRPHCVDSWEKEWSMKPHLASLFCNFDLESNQ